MGKKKIGFFGGTFDPIHYGHLNLAINMQEMHGLDEVLFCPAFVSPHKNDDPPAISQEHRLAMTALAIRPIKHFTLLDWEIQRKGLSFTIDTVRAYLEENKDVQLHLLLGDDTLKNLFRWKEPEELVRLAPPLIGSRHSYEPSCDLSVECLKSIKQGMTRLPIMEISSTDLRQRLAKGLYCGHLIPAKVLDYIYQHQLYSF